MAGGRTIPLLATFFWLIAGGFVAPAHGEVARLSYGDLVTGVVEKVDGDLLTVGGKVYDTRNVTFRFMVGMASLEKPQLRGTRVEILIQKGKIHSVLVLPMKGQ